MALARLIADTALYFANLVAVTKTKPVETIQGFYERGQRLFGENRVQELVEKQALLPADIQWHFIGHLQSKKVKYIAPFVQMIHAVDSWKLLAEINKQATLQERTIKVLLQIKIAQEESKYGLSFKDCQSLLANNDWKNLKHVQICGLMGMATYTNDLGQVRAEFRSLKQNFDELETSFFARQSSFSEISMGMSGDYQIALEEGSTIVRVGSLLYK